uniref:TOG domain-containing protein n=1 Tax=Kalanchoe fedtschenkoi TaxID=63787 RepID=A0A7N0ULM8_KALFE
MTGAQRHTSKPKGRDVFELKHRVVASLNKLADRDTHQLGLQDLHAIVQSLKPDGVSPFLSCILHYDADQKNAVRKECVRLMGHLASFHPLRVVPHLAKIVSSIVKRLKDSDSVVRDACVETIGVIALNLAGNEDGNGVFVLLMKPLFEALGEQNKQLQSGSAFCLSKLIDCSHNPPLPILQHMLNRSIKLLGSSHFVAKPAVIQLITSIIKAGGAPSHTLLSAAMHSIQEALKSSDWNTRKAASTALGDIASSNDPSLGFCRASCIHGLESCRFDKVKPVREAVLQAIKHWQQHPVSLTREHPQTGSSCEGNGYRVHSSFFPIFMKLSLGEH